MTAFAKVRIVGYLLNSPEQTKYPALSPPG